MTRQRMAAVDAAWLHMDRRVNRMIVNSVVWCDGPLDWDRVRAVLQRRLLGRYPRFTQRVVDHRSGVWWEDDDTFELDRHVRHATLRPPGRTDQLQAYVSSVAGLPLARDVPLWEAHFIDGLGGSRSALVVRIHHCIADGMALARVMLSLTDDRRRAALAGVAAPRTEPDGEHGLLPIVGRVAAEIVNDLRDPPYALHQMGQVAGGARAAAHLFGLPPDARTSLHATLGEVKRAVWSDPVPLAALRDTAHAAAVTVNDLVLTAVTGALRAHLARTDGRAPDVHAVIPVNLRKPDAPLPAELGNDFGLAYLRLPASIDDRRERMAELRRRTQAFKRSPEAVVAFGTLGLIGHLPYEAEQLFVEAFSAKASAVITNVVGPSRPLYLAGRRGARHDRLAARVRQPGSGCVDSELRRAGGARPDR